MKNVFADMDTAMNIINQLSEFDAEGMQTIICMSIDTCAAQYGMDAREIADTIKTLVHAVNNELGAYQIA